MTSSPATVIVLRILVGLLSITRDERPFNVQYQAKSRSHRIRTFPLIFSFWEASEIKFCNHQSTFCWHYCYVTEDTLILNVTFVVSTTSSLKMSSLTNSNSTLSFLSNYLPTQPIPESLWDTLIGLCAGREARLRVERNRWLKYFQSLPDNPYDESPTSRSSKFTSSSITLFI